MEIEVPRDSNGDFEPQIIGKYQREWRRFDDKILAMYSYGMSTQGIQATIKDIYNVDISPELVSRVTDEVKGRLMSGGTALLKHFTRLYLLTPCV